MGHRRAPGVQHGGDANPGSEVFRVGRNGEHRLARCPKQQVVDHRLVLIGNVADLGRQREHDVEVGHRQEISLARRHPFARCRPLALGTMPIAATVVGNRGEAAPLVLTARNVPAERRRAAVLDRAHHLQLSEAHMAAVGLTPSGTMVTEQVRDLQGRTGQGAPTMPAS